MATTLLITAGAVVAGCMVERRWSAHPIRLSITLLNVGYFAAAAALHALLIPAFAGLMTLTINYFGGGLIVLPSHGPGLISSVFIYVVVMDLGEYLFHRAQHAIPVLWSMHSLHHSDSALNVSTTVRHFWPEQILKTATIYLIMGVIFKAGPSVVACYTILAFYNYFAHMNVRVGFGRWCWVLNSPQYHRIHHSCLASDFDCNFAALLPIHDILFGTFREPARGEYPPAGLADRGSSVTLVQAFIWPSYRSRDQGKNGNHRKV